MDVDSWVAMQPATQANSAALKASRGRPRPFRPMTLPRGAERLPRGGLLIPMSGCRPWGFDYRGLGQAPSKEEVAAKSAPPADVEAAAKAKETVGFTYMAAGAASAVAGAAMKDLPAVVRIGLALGGTFATILGVKNLAEGEATRQAGLQVGVTLAKCMASQIIGGSKIPA